MGYMFNAIFDDVVMVHCIDETVNANFFARFMQHVRALKTLEMHHITLNDSNIASKTV